MSPTLEALRIEGPRACRLEELGDMIAMTNSVMREGSDQSFLTDYPLVYRADNLENIQIIKVGDDIASVVPFIEKTIEMNECRFQIGIISPTATSPYHRRKGYALQCLNACLDKMSDREIDLAVLWTLVPTFDFYERAGFQAVRSQGWRVDCDDTDSTLFRDNGHKIIDLDIENSIHLGDVQRLYESEEHGVVRARTEYAALFNLPKMRTLLAVDPGGQISGYLLSSHASNKPGILEACGKTASLESLLHHALRQSKNSFLPIYLNLTASPLSNLLKARLPNRFQPLTDGPMMIRINDVLPFLEKIRPWLIEHNGGRNQRFSLEVTDSGEVIGFDFSDAGLKLSRDRYQCHLPLSRDALTSIVFAAHPERPTAIPEALASLFPVYFPIPMLDHS